MRIKYTILALLFLTLNVLGQNSKPTRDALKICSVLQGNGFTTNNEAESALDKILSVIGASKRFVLQPCDGINNAVATSFRGIRYILYDRDFMNTISYGDNWGNIFILAHEVGHHINGHSLDHVLYAVDVVEQKTLSQSRKEELEADEFAGFILAKLGGPLSAGIKALSSSSNNDDTYSTHPKRDKRIAALKKGFNSAKERVYEVKNDVAGEYFSKALESARNSNYTIAVENIKIAIALNEDIHALSVYHTLLGSLYEDLGTPIFAIKEYKKALELRPESWYNYSDLGEVYRKIVKNISKPSEMDLKHMKLSFYYFSKSIEESPEPYYLDYFRIGEYYHFMKNHNEAINYLSKSLSYEPDNEGVIKSIFFLRSRSYYEIGDIYSAIGDATKGLDRFDDSQFHAKQETYWFRAQCKSVIGDTKGYCNDLYEANKLKPDDFFREKIKAAKCKKYISK